MVVGFASQGLRVMSFTGSAIKAWGVSEIWGVSKVLVNNGRICDSLGYRERVHGFMFLVYGWEFEDFEVLFLVEGS